MKTLQRRGFYSMITALVLGFALCGQLLAAPPVVDAYSRFRDGPILLFSTYPGHNGTAQDLVHLDVTSGLYVILAKGFFRAHAGGGTNLDCKLIAGGDSDHIRAGVDGREDFRTFEESFSLNVLHYFQSAGTIVLRCSCEVDDADMSALKVTAVRVNSFWNLPE
jgi:hypothetical protein